MNCLKRAYLYVTRKKGEKYFAFPDSAGNCHFCFEWAMYWRCHKTSADELAEKSWRGL